MHPLTLLTLAAGRCLPSSTFPQHWGHLGGHRTVRTKGALSAKTAKLMVFKLVNAAAKTWRRLNGENQLPKVVQCVKFQNGIEVIKMSAHHAA